MSFDLYKKRLLSYGNGEKEIALNNTKLFINRSFANSFGYSTVKINDVDTEVIIIDKDDSDKKELLLRPEQVAKKGAIVQIDTRYYLVTDFNGNGINQKAKIRLCNTTFLLKGVTTKTIVGYNMFNEPIYEETSSSNLVIPCIVETQITTDDTDKAINLPEGRINVTIPYTEHEDLTNGKEFVMYEEKYMIIGIDYTQTINKEGLMIIHGKKVA